MFTIKWKQNTSDPDTLHGTAFTGLSTLDARELVPGYWHKIVLCSALSTRYVSVYIITRFRPFRHHIILKSELSRDLVKFSGLPCNLQSRCANRVPVPTHFSARVQGLHIVFRHRHYTQIGAWVLHKAKGHSVHISARAQALCPATECERVLKKKSTFT